MGLINGRKGLAFDHDLLARLLATATGKTVEAKKLPLEQVDLGREGRRLQFLALGRAWVFDVQSGELAVDETPPKPLILQAPKQGAKGKHRDGPATLLRVRNEMSEVIKLWWLKRDGGKVSYGEVEAGSERVLQTFGGHRWLMTDDAGEELAVVRAPDFRGLAKITGKVTEPQERRENVSPDGQWRASIRENNLVIEPVQGGEVIFLSRDGAAEDRYQGPFKWSPDSKHLVAFRAKPVKLRQIHLVESSPKDQLQPKLRTVDYAKAGDEISQPKPRLFEIEGRGEIKVGDGWFDNPWSISELAWTADSSAFSFVYNQRGHQVMRLLSVDSTSGKVRLIHEEASRTFIDYSQKFFLKHLANTREMIWASERDGFNHLYLIDEAAGGIKTQITRGEWNVREVLEVDEEGRRLLLKIVGMKGQDPYHEHLARVNFDGSDWVALTDGDGTQRVEFSPDKKRLVATWSRVDQPPVTELRDAQTGDRIAEIARADDAALRQLGLGRVERFVAAGRDGKTPIYGAIIKPSNFDPAKKYPVVEEIYAGPHGHFVPKAHHAWSGMQEMAENGFVVVKIDGMGTNWRSKAFHDLAWKNLADSGFPDRKAWIKAAAGERPWMDLERVGIYGGSAGGQSTVAALLHHGDFYKVGVADCGCHDNRMDKIWWNEAWMGWPVDEAYERSSNVVHASKLRGELMLIVGELDSNVDPASTLQLAGALQKGGKDFEMVTVINTGHGAAETAFGKMKRANFLMRHLLGNGR
ncbi:prolyl oligopeptidase family serine peptidase [Phragmitibacter flavus]|uniref:prolyl oligopeptidase family serine peptidase n=1 Tax=Phragmitibacter flavus TaxID=2576071 RepID=UPI00140D706D|nr:DPP IV N-terminal domain-containing protein [Phragmitibacter flavus]